MKLESIVFAIAGMLFGVILGWILASQQVSSQPAAPAPQAQTQTGGTERQPPTLDEGRVQALMTIIKSDPKNAGAHAQLANVYFDAERWPDAIQWYERALKLDPNNPDISTDLGVSYYYTNRTDEALAQFEKSLKINPKHTKTLLNKGIVLAFGKQDLARAADEWKKVVDIAPDSPEGQAAKRALEGVAAAHAREQGTTNQ